MSLVCSISGSAPTDPVVSKTGYIFERRHVEKHIAATGTCPITQEPLTVEDLLPVKANKAVKPRAATASSIPGLLSLMQSEWDVVMSETFTLRSHLDTVRSQLSHTLYQHDAACRCIARLIRERDTARSQIADLQQRLASTPSYKSQHPGGGGAEELSEPGISEEIMQQMTTMESKLRSGRKKRAMSAVISSVDEVRAFEESGSYPLHKTTTPGVLCLDVEAQANLGIIATGGMDSNVVIFSLQQRKAISKLSGHLKKVNAVLLHPEEDCLITGSDDKTIRIWKGEGEEKHLSEQYKCAHTIRTLTGEVIDLSLHPIGDYCVSVAKHTSWSLHDIPAGRTLHTTRDIPCEYRCIQLHPDGLLLGGGGTDSTVHMWDVRDCNELKAQLEGHTAPINCLAFSQNGYYLATGSDDGTVRLWDLRKREAMSFQTIAAVGQVDAPVPVNSVAFDYSGNYIAVGAGNDVEVHYFESKSHAAKVVTLSGHEDKVTAAKFGPEARYLVSTSMDRSVRLWEPSADGKKSSGRGESEGSGSRSEKGGERSEKGGEKKMKSS